MGSLQIFEIVQIVPNRAKHLVKGVEQIQKSTAWVIWNLFFLLSWQLISVGLTTLSLLQKISNPVML